MVVVIVGYEHGINGRQVFQTEAGPAVSFGTYPGEGTAAVRPNRIYKNIEPIHLNQKAGVTNSGNSEGPFRYAGRRRWAGRIFLEFRPSRVNVAGHPLPEVAQNAPFRRVTR